MLVLSRETREEIVLTLEDGRRITVTLIEIRSMRKVRLGVECPKTISVNRGEIQRQIDAAAAPPHGPGVA